MIDFAPYPSTTEPLSRPQVWIRRLVLGMAAATLFLMALGSATRVMNAGLACPDWPLCYGELIPRQQMNLQVFLEWFHRLIASSMGLFAIGLTTLSWWYRRTLPHWLPWAATFALGLVVFQGILGGLTVTQLLRFDIVTAHLGTGLLFFVTLLTIGIALLPYQGVGTSGKLPWIGLIAALLVYAQSLLGGLVASQWALHQCLGTAKLCLVMNSHIAGVVPATLATLGLVVWAWRTPALHPTLRRWATIAGSLVGVQILLGVATFKLRLQVEPLTVAHQAVGAMLLGSLVIFTVLAWRDRVLESSEPSAIASPAPATPPLTNTTDGQPA
ncbi:COX15/CtaA family protein [Pantanalinema rosaneae CENA516]|uniref:COX15/CtaA family protein n=1 Tax=Pantanalinema rosaneae TaxID=1620701 RepID=UPI003D6F8AF0